MRLRPYPSYKDSRFEWIGQVPADWDVVPLGYFADTIVPMRDKPEKLDGEIPWIRIEDFDGKFISQSKSDQGVSLDTIREMNLKVFEIGTVLCSCSCGMGVTAIASNKLVSNQTFIGIKSLGRFIPEFLFYSLNASSDHLNSISTGAIQQYLSKEDFRRLRLAAPTVTMQVQIVSFLDRETGKLDTLISKQEHLIELLQEKRQAIISHAVTKGLDPDAKMKDSGVEWLGMVPEGWTVLQFRHMVSIQNGSDYKHIESEDGPYPVIGSGGEFKRATDYIYDGVSVLLGRKGTIDKPLFIEGKFWVVDTMFYTIINDIVLPKYVFNCAKIIPFDLLSTSTALPSMTQNDLKTLYFAMPKSLSEQEAIINYIDEQTSKIDTLINKAKRSIELAKEHRTALISAAVTGKIDVREAA